MHYFIEKIIYSIEIIVTFFPNFPSYLKVMDPTRNRHSRRRHDILLAWSQSQGTNTA